MGLEMLISPSRSERRPWEMLIIGLIYASLAVIIVQWVFSKDIILAKFSGILIVTFTVMFTLPFFYQMIRMEEEKDTAITETRTLLKEHAKAINSLLWLFIGFIIAFSFWFIVLGNTDNYMAQIETYCAINNPSNLNNCVAEYGGKTTGFVSAGFSSFGLIFTNNLYVLMFTILFSVIFGAGGIFILAWNATVISAAVVIFSQADISRMPVSIARYMIHGIPEIGAYFMGTLAGGIIGLSIIKKEYKTDKFWNIIHDSLLMVIGAIIVLIIAAFIEIYITPQFF